MHITLCKTRQNIAQNIFMIFSLSAALCSTSSAAAGKELNTANWKKICDISEDLDTVPSVAYTKVQTAMQEALNMRRSAERTMLYALTTDDDLEIEKAALIAAYLATKAENKEKETKDQLLKSATTATAYASYSKGNVDEFLRLAASASDGTDNCLETTDNGNFAQITDGKLANYKCKLSISAQTTAATTPSTIGATGFSDQVFPTQSGNTAQSSSKSCRLLTIHQAGYSSGQVSATEMNYAGGLFKTDKCSVSNDGSRDAKHTRRRDQYSYMAQNVSANPQHTRKRPNGEHKQNNGGNRRQ
uniref:Variant surface glycoprotein 1125.5475 n=1 Tax=Trypanosoma brucei TaxID=5691 RepID=A0A1J0RCR2_9TRYP|nr:variant surface glycoprotein 1125.5475 [Trypanosoma brucei]